ncbi:DUF6518 family protein [Motilibacter aurantiacus]|uniref:DUF6518 family protein n=1 Tax=Motilibacter aurantiacus TaxID=2714955 RepID=UPI002F2B33CC
MAATDRRHARAVAYALLAAVAAGLLGGAATAWAQAVLPGVLAPLANSAGAWSVLALLIAWRAPGLPAAAGCGVLVLLGLDLGYGVAAELMGNTWLSSTAAAFWAVCALVVGGPLGVCARLVRRGRAWQAATAAGAVAGVLVGEAVYGLTVVAETTPAAYWWGQAVAAGVSLAMVARVRRFPARLVLVAAAVALLSSTAFVLVYRMNLLSLL